MWPFRRGSGRSGEGPDGAGSTPRPGDLIDGKYRVERVLGVGGMGVVVAARHQRLGETVAIKLLLPQAARTTADVQRFLREGRAASRLRSEHVVRVLDLGEQPGGAPYLVMEHLLGRDLSAVLMQDGPLPVEDALGYLLDACESIGEAHAVGVVHRDLKPANLFLARRADGSPCLKVLDFGISKVAEPDDLSLTQTRTLMGSPVYMAPEIMRSARAAGPSSDIWSLGVIFYELLTGVVPFHADTITELTIKVLEEEARPLSMFRSDVSPELDGIVRTCLAKDPNRRFRTVEDLALALATCLGLAGMARLERLRRVVRDAEQRARQNAEASGDFQLPPLRAEGATTIRGLTTASLRAPHRSRAALVIGLGGLSVAAAVGATIVLSGRDEPRPAGSKDTAAAVVTSATALPAVAAAPTPVAPSASTSTSTSTKPSVAPKPKAIPQKPGKPTVGSPYFDDPN
ncbi:MAG: serine/threonine protein kinase [Myxococcales bacterium]|nr:serine/threonine protein kinase [Myxococcales bacterium]